MLIKFSFSFLQNRVNVEESLKTRNADILHILLDAFVIGFIIVLFEKLGIECKLLTFLFSSLLSFLGCLLVLAGDKFKYFMGEGVGCIDAVAVYFLVVVEGGRDVSPNVVSVEGVEVLGLAYFEKRDVEGIFCVDFLGKDKSTFLAISWLI